MGLVAHGMWDLPRPGIEPMSPALAGGFLTTGPPGKSSHSLFDEYPNPGQGMGVKHNSGP